jgi:hypothetical protein
MRLIKRRWKMEEAVRKSGVVVFLATLTWTTVSFAQAVPTSTDAAKTKTNDSAVQSGGTAGTAATPTKLPDSNNPTPPPPSKREVVCAIKYAKPGDPAKTPLADNSLVPSSDWLVEPQKCANDDSENQFQADPTVGLDDTLYLLVDFGTPQPATSDQSRPDIEDWRISINGVEIEDGKLHWSQYDQGKTAAILSVQLSRSDTSEGAWNQLFAQKIGNRLVPVTIVDDSKKPILSFAHFHLHVISLHWYSWILLGILVGLLVILVTNDRLKAMLRDSGAVKRNDGNPPKAAYSLARVQMFYWFAIVIVCYVVLWIITGDRDTVNNDVLALIGISSGTLLGAAAIDSSKKSQAQSDLPDATAKLQQTQASAAALTTAVGAGQPAAIVAQQAATLQQRAVTQLTDRTLADYNVGFLTDILSDENGLSFHRFQMFSWSLVLGVIFIASVIQTLAMPTFGNTLLGLMGISGGTYLGFKFPEQKTP